MKQALYNWFEKIKNALQDRGLESSDIDHCVIISKDIIILVYVDDCIFLAKEYSKIDTFIKSLAKKYVHKNAEFEFTNEDQLNNYLEIKFNKRDCVTMEMKHEFLIE